MKVVHRMGYSLLAFIFVVLSGCSLVLDPTECSSDSDCNDGRCVSGVCVIDVVAPDIEISPEDMSLQDTALEPDMQIADSALADAEPMEDMMLLTPDMMVPNEPPTCVIITEAELVGGQEALITLRVTDSDDPVAGLEVSFNDTELTLDDDGLYEGVFLLQDGANTFRLVAVSNGQTCSDTLTIVSDRSSPRIIDARPAIGQTIKSGNGRVFVSATVIEEHFAPDLSIFVDGMVYPIEEEEVDWTDQTYILELDLERGLHEVEVLITDQVGNISRSALNRDCSVESCAHSFRVDVDSEPPTIILDALQTDRVNRIPGRSVTLAGTVIDDESPVSMAVMELTVSPQVGAPRMVALRTDENGRFEQSIDVLDENSSSATIELCAEDIATNRGCITVEIEKQLPCVEISSPEPGLILASASVNITGTICDGVDRLEFRRNGESVNFFSVTGQESFTRNLIVPTNGSHNITVIAYNDALGETAQDSVTISRDDSPPVLSITRPLIANDGSPTCTQSIFEVCVNVSDPESQVRALKLGSIQIPANQILGTVCRQASAPRGAEINYTVEATNGAGTTTTQSILLNVDDVAPSVTFTEPNGIQPINPWIKTDDGQVLVSGTIDTGVCGVEAFFINDTQTNVSREGNFQVILPFEEGQQTVGYRVTDAAGNERSNNYAFRVDDTSPNLSVVSAIPTHTKETILQLTIAASDQMSRIDIGSLTINDIAYGLSSITPTQAEATVNLGLEEGENEFEIRVTDTVGNSASTRVSVIRDTTAPSIEVLSPSDNQAVTVPTVVRGTITDGATGIGNSSVVVNGVEAVVDAESGTWLATNVPVEPTVRTIEVGALDGLGNETASTTINVRIPEFAQYRGEASGIPLRAAVSAKIHAADLNGDNLIDLVELNEVDGRCLLQGADGTFSASTADECGLPLQNNYLCSKMGDLDGDGRLDLVYFDSDSSALMLGGGDGTFLPSGVNMVVDENITDCELLDIDRNGRLDLVAVSPTNVYVLLLNDDNEFDLEPATNLGLSGLSAYENLEAVDLNNDGFMDLVASGGVAEANDGDPAGMSIFQGSFGGAFQEVTVANQLPHSGANEYMVLPIDADQDGQLELILLGQTTILFDRSAADADTFEFAQNNQLQASFADQRVIARTDANVDGRDDLLIFGDFGVRIIQNFGGGSFGPLDSSFIGLGALGAVHQATVVDLDGDGDEDWILGTDAGLQIWKSNQAQRDPNYGFVRIHVRRFKRDAVHRPIDNHGPLLFVELLTQQEMDDDEGQLIAVEPERALPPRPNAPTIITLGTSVGAHVEARYVDKFLIGSRLRQELGLLSSETAEIFSRE